MYSSINSESLSASNPHYSFLIPSQQYTDEEEKSESNKNYVIIPPFDFEKYCTKREMKVRLDIIDDGEYIAEFEEAAIAFSATTLTEAIQLLKAQIIYTYETYKKNKQLGPEPLRQLRILETYIAEKGR